MRNVTAKRHLVNMMLRAMQLNQYMSDTNDNDELPPVAQAAWETYLRMSATKNTYYEFLQSLDQKYDKGETPSADENKELEVMLKAHSETVSKFNDAMRAVEDPDDRALLLNKMG